MLLFLIISVVSDSVLRVCIQESLLVLKKITVLNTLSANNSLLVRYNVYLSDPRKCVCTSRRYAEAYENLSINPAPCLKNPIKNEIVIPKCQPLLLEENYSEIKA